MGLRAGTLMASIRAKKSRDAGVGRECALSWVSRGVVLMLVLGAVLASACGNGALQTKAAEEPEATPTAVAGRVSAGFSADCYRVGRSAELRVRYTISALQEKRLTNVYVNVNGQTIFDSGDIDETRVTGTKVIDALLGSANRVELVAMPQDGRSATARQTIHCPGGDAPFRAVAPGADLGVDELLVRAQ